MYHSLMSTARQASSRLIAKDINKKHIGHNAMRYEDNRHNAASQSVTSQQLPIQLVHKKSGNKTAKNGHKKKQVE